MASDGALPVVDKIAHGEYRPLALNLANIPGQLQPRPFVKFKAFLWINAPQMWSSTSHLQLSSTPPFRTSRNSFIRLESMGAVGAFARNNTPLMK